MDLARHLAETDDLDEALRLLVRERAIREIMADSWESREIVVEQMDAMDSMNREAVLDLTGGKPTTLRDALADYVEVLGGRDEIIPRDGVIADLDAILTYPWQAEEEALKTHDINSSLRIKVQVTDDEVSVRMGENGWAVATVPMEPTGRVHVHDVSAVVSAVHRAVLVRVIGDRDHHVGVPARFIPDMIEWLQRPSGSWRPQVADGEPWSRFSMDAGGPGIIVKTWPYQFQTAARTRGGIEQN